LFSRSEYSFQLFKEIDWSRKMKISGWCGMALVVALILMANAKNSQAVDTSHGFTVLHSFNRDTEGSGPAGSLTLSGSTLYGMTYTGGVGFTGTVFSVEKSGSNFNVLHNFTYDDWGNAEGGLAQNGSTLYGVTPFGGTNNSGRIFNIGTDGANMNNLHSFTGLMNGGPNNDGCFPQANTPLLIGSKLYGTTTYGGNNGVGILYSMNSDGTGYNILHSFAGNAVDEGGNPFYGLTAIGSTLYGATNSSIYGINADGSNFHLLQSNVWSTMGTLQPLGSMLYAMTDSYIYSINPNGANYKVLYTFPNRNKFYGRGGLTIVGSTLYGMTSECDGLGKDGTLFSLNSDGTNFTTLHRFTSASTDPRDMYGNLISDGSNLYGMTYSGGIYDSGAIFSIAIPEPSTIIMLLSAALCGLFLGRRKV
jgi:uncharacterized repeat protein (TIGR03803 family)